MANKLRKTLAQASRPPVAAAHWLRQAVGLREVHTYGGLALAGVGAGMLWGAGAGMLLAGTALVYLGVWHSRRPTTR